MSDTLNINTSNWMSTLDDKTPLSDINIPGTHDAAAIGSRSSIPAIVIDNQKISITNQLKSGIRLLDIRLKVKKVGTKNLPTYKFTTCHGNTETVDQDKIINEFQSFESVLEECHHFLETYPSETVIMLLKFDYGGGLRPNHTTAIKDALLDLFNEDTIIREKQIPSLKESRGKIVLMNRIENSLKFGTYIKWASETDGQAIPKSRYRGFAAYVQDNYLLLSFSVKQDKLTLVRNAFEKKSDGMVVLNFASCASLLGSNINSLLISHFGETSSADRRKKLGWTLFDLAFDTSKTNTYGNLNIVELIIDSNFNYRQYPNKFLIE
jgi:1-phosphatidylinositol phosphodiesterase